MKNILLASLCLFFLNSCKKENEEKSEEKQTVNWKIVMNFPADKSYNLAKVVAFNGKAFVSTFGHAGITAGSEGSLSNTFSGTFFFQNGTDWYQNILPNQAVIALKEYNGALYGIRENKTVFRTSPVVAYQHSYTLFKWENNNYTNLDVLEYTNSNLVEKAMLIDPDLWVNNNKLYLVANTSNATTKLWEVNSSNKLVMVGGEITPLPTPRLLTDNKEIAHTSVQTFQDGFITRYFVKGHFYNFNIGLKIGNTFEFYTELLANGNVHKSTKDVNWLAVNGELFGMGFENNKVKNHNTGNIVATLSSGKVFREDIMVRKNGKLYMMLGDEKEISACKGLAIFDGVTLKEVAFNLPEPLDPCSRLIDATELNGKTYLLLNNRRQYVVVESM